MRRVTGETLLSALAVVALVGVLVAADPRVRDQVGTILSRDGAGSTIATAGQTASDVGSALLQSARDQSVAHAPLLVFGVAAAVLVIFMLRT